MDIEYGVLVVDKNGEALGTISQIILDTWTGEPRKFVVRREAPKETVFFSPEHVSKATEEKVQLNIPIEELEQVQ